MIWRSCRVGSGATAGRRGASPGFAVGDPAGQALAARVDGEHRYTASSAVPLRPGKLRLKVRSDGRPETGAWPMPMQGLQIGSSILAPAASRSWETPERPMTSRTA